MREMNCPFGCQDVHGGSTVYPWDDGESFKCSVSKARWTFVILPEDIQITPEKPTNWIITFDETPGI